MLRQSSGSAKGKRRIWKTRKQEEDPERAREIEGAVQSASSSEVTAWIPLRNLRESVFNLRLRLPLNDLSDSANPHSAR